MLSKTYILVVNLAISFVRFRHQSLCLDKLKRVIADLHVIQ